jgi:hypothetical protein
MKVRAAFRVQPGGVDDGEWKEVVFFFALIHHGKHRRLTPVRLHDVDDATHG